MIRAQDDADAFGMDLKAASGGMQSSELTRRTEGRLDHANRALSGLKTRKAQGAEVGRIG